MTQTLEQFGQTIKTKYPQYNNMSDVDVANATIKKYPQYQSQITPDTSTGTPGATIGTQTASKPGLLQNIGSEISKNVGGTLKTMGNTVTGIAKGIGQTVVGAGKTTSDILGMIPGQVGQFFKGGAQLGQQTLQSPTLKPQGTAQSIGNFAEKAGELLLPTKGITAAKEITAGIGAATEATSIGSAISRVPVVGKILGNITQTVLNALPEAGVGFTWGKTQGQSNKEAAGTGATFGILSALGEVAGTTWKSITGNIADNTLKALGMPRQFKLSDAGGVVPQAISALKTIADNTEGMVVKGIDGVEKAFDPTKATLFEQGQAFTQTKQKIYDQYTALAEKAGDKNAKFTADDFSKVQTELQSLLKNTTGSTKNAVEGYINDLKSNYGNVVKIKGGEMIKFTDTSLNNIQNFIQSVNKDVNPLSNKAGADVADKLSSSLRKIMDSKIESATDEGYQAIRKQYSDLKGIEKQLTNQVKKSLSQTGGKLSGFIEGVSSLESLVSVASGDFSGAVRKGIPAIVGKVMDIAKDPELSLQRAFQQLKPQEQSTLQTRAFGVPAPSGVITK
jgi:hypothetical protein